MQRIFLAVILASLTLGAQASNVAFQFGNPTNSLPYLSEVTLTPTNFPTVIGPVIVINETLKLKTDASGQCVFSNLYPWRYLVHFTLAGKNMTSDFQITLTNALSDTSTIAASSILTAPTNSSPSGMVAYSMASADARFLPKSAPAFTGGLTGDDATLNGGLQVTDEADFNGDVFINGMLASSTGPLHIGGFGTNAAIADTVLVATHGFVGDGSGLTNLPSSGAGTPVLAGANITIALVGGSNQISAPNLITATNATNLVVGYAQPLNANLTGFSLFSTGAVAYVTQLAATNAALQAQITANLANQNGSNTAIIGLANTVGSQLIGTSGIEYGWTNVTPNSAHQEGRINQGSYTAYYHAIGTTPGAWNANTMFNGTVLIGSQYWMSNYPPSGSALYIWHGGSPDFFGTNGSAALSELAEVKNLGDGRQGYYANYSVPIGATATNWIMSGPQHMQFGAIGYLYGSNTLAGMTLTPGLVSAIDAGYNWYLTTTVDRGIYGTRLALGYDNAAQIFYIGDDIVGNGSFGMTGFKSLATFDAGNHKIYFTNGLTTLKDLTFTGVGLFAGTNITVGNNGTANIANGSFARMTLNAGGGSVCTPALGMNGFGFACPDGSTFAAGFCFNTITTNIWIDRAANSMYLQNAVAIGASNNLPQTTNIFEANALGGRVNIGTNGVLYGNAGGLTAIPSANLTGALPAISGSALTSINGQALASGTVNSNKLDVATLAILALAGTVGGSGIATSNGFGTNTTLVNLTNDFMTASTGTWSLLGSNGANRMLFNSTAFQVFDGVMATARQTWSGTGDVTIRQTNGVVGWRFGKDGDFTAGGNTTLGQITLTNVATIGLRITNNIITATTNGTDATVVMLASNRFTLQFNGSGSNEVQVQQGGMTIPGSLTMAGGASITAGTNFTAAKPALDMRVGAGALGVYGGNGGIGDYMGFALAGTAKVLFAGGMMLSARNYSIGWQSSINAGAGADASVTSTAAGSVTITTNLIVPGTITATNGYQLPPIAAFSGAISNGMSQTWNSNAFVYRRTTRLAATNWLDTLIGSPP